MTLLAEMSANQTIATCVLGGLAIIAVVVIVWLITRYLSG